RRPQGLIHRIFVNPPPPPGHRGPDAPPPPPPPPPPHPPSFSSPPLTVSPAPSSIKRRGAAHLFRCLNPHTRLCPRAQPDRPMAVAVPPIAIIFADKLRDPVLERRLGSARPQVRWLKHVIVRGYHPVIHHDLTLLLGVALSRCCRLNDLTGQTIPPARRAPYREVRWRPLRA